RLLVVLLLLSSIISRSPPLALFPYTTLFRSLPSCMARTSSACTRQPKWSRSHGSPTASSILRFADTCEAATSLGLSRQELIPKAVRVLRFQLLLHRARKKGRNDSLDFQG